MRNTNQITRMCVIAAVSMGVLAACTNRSNDKTSDRSFITRDTSATKDASTSNTTVAKRKARTTISKPAANKDRMVRDKEGGYCV